MSSEDFVNALQKGDNLEAEQAFKKEMSDRIGHSLEAKRIEVANSFVKTKKVEDDAEEVWFFLHTSCRKRWT